LGRRSSVNLNTFQSSLAKGLIQWRAGRRYHIYEALILLLILVAVEQLESILEDSDKRINALLTAEQQKTHADVEQEMRAQLKARRAQGAATT